MSDVERYFAMPVKNGVDMVPDQDGRWVDYDAYRSLEDQLATLRSEVASVRAHLDSYARTLDLAPTLARTPGLIDALREDSERLGKLGGGEK